MSKNIRWLLCSFAVAFVFLMVPTDVSAQAGDSSSVIDDFIGYADYPDLTWEDIVNELFGPDEPWGLPEDWTEEELLDWLLGYEDDPEL